LEEIDARIRSRMLDRQLCQIYAIDAPPYHPGGNATRRGGKRAVAH
jgi:hypothetical protein